MSLCTFKELKRERFHRGVEPMCRLVTPYRGHVRDARGVVAGGLVYRGVGFVSHRFKVSSAAHRASVTRPPIFPRWKFDLQLMSC